MESSLVDGQLYAWDDDKHVQDPRGIEHMTATSGLPHELHKRQLSSNAPNVSTSRLGERDF